ncbi:hypothetical protein BS50DRAFT_261114 [Corynespora cassiicola Philippines]|uniref:Uncharacterized protein n=1 Tax=Corynespora cassiicola Philippines TaxID=1448308 RepID=A0A2T2N1A2_CORCC|nr:hypothetical protein BS50DRAFT_261114 [Corynespora cassiicola Philippines]
MASHKVYVLSFNMQFQTLSVFILYSMALSHTFAVEELDRSDHNLSSEGNMEIHIQIELEDPQGPVNVSFSVADTTHSALDVKSNYSSAELAAHTPCGGGFSTPFDNMTLWLPTATTRGFFNSTALPSATGSFRTLSPVDASLLSSNTFGGPHPALSLIFLGISFSSIANVLF